MLPPQWSNALDTIHRYFTRSQRLLVGSLFLLCIVIGAGLSTLGVLQALAAPPSLITYEGRVMTPDGTAVTTTVAMKLVLYDDPTAGTKLYTAAGTLASPTTITVSPTSSGAFSIELGGSSTNSLDPQIFKNNSSVYLEVSINGETLSPRKQVNSVPYAFNSLYLNGVGSDTVSSSQYIPLSDSRGNFNFNQVTTTFVSSTNGIAVSGSSTLGSTYISSLTVGSSPSLALLGNTQTFTGLNTFSVTTTFSSTTISNALLSVENGTIFASGTIGTTPGSGAGTRLMWIPSKAAFRAGYVDGSQWDDANIANYSAAFGYKNTASGFSSFAAGYTNTVSGSYGFTGGNANTVSGFGSVALGTSNTANGPFFSAVAIGYSNTASANAAVAIGYSSTASAASAVAIGESNTASAGNATAMGKNMTVSGSNSFGINLNGGSAKTLSQANSMSIMGGNVGIGSLTPDNTLTVAGTLSVSGDSTFATSTFTSSTINNANIGNLVITGSCVGCGGGASSTLLADFNNFTGLNTFSATTTFSSTTISNGLLTVENGALFASGTIGVTPGSGAGTRLMWIPSKAAFRAGSVDGSQWNNANVGTDSIALGKNNTASGFNTVVLGTGNSASASNAMALGNENTASGNNSSAIGNQVTASGVLSMAFGYKLTVSGQNSIGFNLDDTSRTVSADRIMAILGGNVGIGTANPGYTLSVTGTLGVSATSTFTTTTIASSTIGNANIGNLVLTGSCVGCGGASSTLLADFNTFTGLNTFSVTTTLASTTINGAQLEIANGPILASGNIGDTPTSGAGTRLMWIPSKAAFRAGYVNGTQWNDANIGDYSTAFGKNNTASGSQSFVVGNGNTANGAGSAVFGEGNSATGSFYEFAMGYNNAVSSGEVNMAFGHSNTVNAAAGGCGAYALGYNHTVSSPCSVALGTQNNIGGSSYNFALGGSNSITAGQYNLALGYNNSISAIRSIALGSYMGVSGDNSVGIGLSNSSFSLSQSNTMAVMGGNVGIGTVSPGGVLHVYATGGIGTTPISEKGGASTDELYIASRQLSTKNSDMSDGFGTGIEFAIRDDANTINNIGYIGAVRAGADNTGDLVFAPRTAGTGNERMRIKANGNVGVGTASPSARLSVVAASGGSADLIADFGVPGSTRFKFYDELDDSTGPKIYSDAGRPFILGAGGTISLQPGNNTGKVGILTSSPGSNLQINGTSGNTSGIRVVGGSVIGGFYQNDATLFSMGTISNHGAQIITNDTARLTVLATGNIGIATANPGFTLSASGTLGVASTSTFFATSTFTNASGLSGLQIFSTLTTTTLKSFATGNGAGAFVLDTENAFTVASSSILLSLRNQGSPVFSVASDGGVRATGTIVSNADGTSIGDVAEYVNITPGTTVQPGDVVVTDEAGLGTFKASSGAYAKQVAGVISDTGRFVMGSSGKDRAALALSGLVKTNVTNENGAIKAGDYLVTATKPGFAMKYDENSTKSAGIVGMALEALDTAEGKITILVNKGFFTPTTGIGGSLQLSENNSGELVNTGTIDLHNQILVNIKSIASANGAWSIDEEGGLVAKVVKADKGQFKELVIEPNADAEKSTVGQGTIKAGDSSVTISNTLATPEASIFVTFLTNPQSSWWLDQSASGSFKVFIGQAASQDIRFKYWIVSSPVSETLVPSPSDVATPSPESTPLPDSNIAPDAAPSSTPAAEEPPAATPTEDSPASEDSSLQSN